MGISRRSALSGIATGAAATGLMACDSNSQISSSHEAPRSSALPPLNLPTTPSSLFYNKARAADILAEEKVDLLICSEPRNIYYLTNQKPMTYRLGMNDYSYATLAAKTPDKPTFIIGRFGVFLGGVADTEIFKDLDYKLFSLPADPVSFASLTDINDIINAPVFENFYPRLHQEVPLVPHIKRKRDNDQIAIQEHFASVEGALIKDLLDTDLENKTVAIDHPKIRETLAKSGLDLRIVDGERIIRKIRLQKTAAELELARYAIKTNAMATRNAVSSIRAGASLQDIRTEFSRHCGANLSRPVWMVIDSIVPELIPGEIQEGRTLMIDCVSEFQGYHGDFGRTVCIGDPTRQMQSIVNALSDTWDRLMPMLKVGTKYSEIYAVSTKLFAETGIDAGFAINPHGVGLQHTDEPSKSDFGLWEKDDIELVENMILSIDMPLLDNGLGGTAHLEDLVLIGKDGPELLNSSDDRFIVV